MRCFSSGSLLVALLQFYTIVSASGQTTDHGVRKLSDIIVYKDEKFYCGFPSIVRRKDGELLVAFRRAPERRKFGESGISHTDPNSYLVLVRSRDEGKTWSTDPELIFANPFGGSQDPCLLQLRDGSLLCASYGWALMPKGAANLKDLHKQGDFAFLGGYQLHSDDGGRHWRGPTIPPPTPGEASLDPFGKPIPAYNRGAMCEGKNGKIYWAVAASTKTSAPRSEVHLFTSIDKGNHWTYECPIAADSKVTFNESSLYQTTKGDLVRFMRTDNFSDHTTIARSTDGCKSFQPWEDAGFQGHPHYALGLPDKRVLLLYGYRHAPFGVRGRLLDPECRDIKASSEFILREDGGNHDLGYPWATLLSNNRVLVVYYFNQENGTRHIAGTILEIEK